MFDPNIPQANTEIDAVEMRGQLNGLKALIDAIQSITAAQVDGVTTLNPGDPATATVSVVGSTLHLTFAIPRGDEGLPGAQGPPFAQALVDAVNTLPPGSNATVTASFDGTNVHFTFGIPSGLDGIQGVPGMQGPPFAQALVDAVNTLAPGTPATVSVSFDGTNVHFTFGIPSGEQGIPGIEGAPGEVTNAALASAISTAISGTSNNTNAVATMDTPFANDPPSLADLELMRTKYNELVLAGRR